MAIAEGRVFEFDDESKIKSDFLENFDYDGSRQEIVYETDEFSAVCPFSGLPDYAYLKIVYIPKKHIVELKSLKYYIISFRNVGIYQEKATDRIYKDLYRCLDPEYLQITTIYNVRGGIKSTCTMDSIKHG
ncbi:MAG: NADPH-dependent 7-cyano-7-deazaguanine reductase QueF [Candidatus Delongbacteria bacterium]|nr:NADPH-dependent 7-cyano-7-deazaguanine reductase QueF [Candidatus Delongbacteria bacterium]MBN2833876.1 NADPH-dependent 7-cyano-7-deazaguanine reductase QueF [Candidatus Delongbacteria bacterium]